MTTSKNIMASNNNAMTSGDYYSLADLFSGEKKIIIPDLQRDYCWGDNMHTDSKKELVSDFLLNLKSSFDEFQKLKEDTKKAYELTLGLIYAYENPKNHIQLCDGQQRLTTLYLLLGMLNKKCQDNPFQKHLISDFELNYDDKEPYLLYAIRESTLYFLSDLVENFFLTKENQVKDIKKQDWYFKDYDLDPSIQSMLEALTIIETKIKEVDCKFFGDFLLKNLKFLYYDIQNRQMGEETFVIINTTGEPLTATENLKPILIGNIEDSTDRKKQSDLWEEREAWFWQNKKDDEHEADIGMNHFLNIIVDIEGEKQQKDLLLEKIERYFRSFKYLIENYDEIQKYRKDFEIEDFKKNYYNISNYKAVALYPVLIYLNNFDLYSWNEKNYISSSDTPDLKELYRIIRYFSNVSKYSEAKEQVKKIAKQVFNSKTSKILDLLDIEINENFNRVLSEEEKKKLSLFQQFAEKREDLEYLFWQLEDNDMFNGQINQLIKFNQEENNCAIKIFENTKKIVDENFKTDNEEIYLAILATDDGFSDNLFGEGWSIGRRRYNFGEKLSDWQKLAKSALFINILNQLYDNESLENIIKKGLSEEKDERNKQIKEKIVECAIASNLWQWRNKKRLVFDDTTIYFPNGTSFGSNTISFTIED